MNAGEAVEELIAMRLDSCTKIALLGGGLLALFACDRPDWKPKVIADAEKQIRAVLRDPNAQFSQVQVTGNDTTGQACGYVTANPPAAAQGGTGRFIFYIDDEAHPFIEYAVGISTVSQEKFDFDWQADCVNEGYKS
jgi:hypothetical protein